MYIDKQMQRNKLPQYKTLWRSGFFQLERQNDPHEG